MKSADEKKGAAALRPRRKPVGSAAARDVSRRAVDDDIDDEPLEAEAVEERESPRRRSPRRGEKRRVLRAIRELPRYMRLLGGLMADRRVSTGDKTLVALAIAYVVAPVDAIPDLVPFLGQVDDVFILMTAVQRLIANAGRKVLRDHWTGDPQELEELNVARVLGSAGFFLPAKMRKKLRRMAAA